MENKINIKIQKIIAIVTKNKVQESTIIMRWPSQHWSATNVRKLFNIYEVFSLIEDEFNIKMPLDFYPQTVLEIEQKVAELI
ncbi:hypothetical protein [Weissella sagaensis]|uniref:hypothetical protein n=1 Tax=Weissella sagaensis TaxID=2559928 RepID=UPI00214CDE7D|nr:hypothetical protein [Weissella sagaensis]